MSFFKDQLERDARNILLNPNEFGGVHLIDDREIVIVIDDDQLQRRRSNNANPTDGVYNASLLFYALKMDFPKKPVIGQKMKVDARHYLVADVQEDEALYTITLKRNAS